MSIMTNLEQLRKTLKDDSWIVFTHSEDEFFDYLEQKYFKPGTSKNAEYEIFIVQAPKYLKRLIFHRVKDTPENRLILKKAIEEFYKCEIGPGWNKRLMEKQRQLREGLDDWLEQPEGDVRDYTRKGKPKTSYIS